MTDKHIVIVRTGGGNAYSQRIARSIQWIQDNKPQIAGGNRFSTDIVSVGALREFFASLGARDPNNTLIYSRAAYPSRTGWMHHLFNLKDAGYTVINDPEVLYLTSHKLECSLRLQNHFPHPRTWSWNKRFSWAEKGMIMGDIGVYNRTGVVIKPLTSINQGASVKKITEHLDYEAFSNEVESVPGNPVVIQELVPYAAIYRVIVIGGRALPYSFVDRPTHDRWKVSVCLNRTSMEFVPNPSPKLLELAEKIQRFIGGEINFIDIFETEPDQFVISEINTACNLRIHENLARDAGHPRWNIHFNIAKYLVERSLK